MTQNVIAGYKRADQSAQTTFLTQEIETLGLIT